ncbi:hypothetical protein DEO72_LG5g1219 [Vigna unguiculata]|uniref:Uncharacterized protein n=1 Tax=Vigna unguiculata TaxID=3917 RepID=A0A4D6LXT0_VIGUN|nr:hypothetical protein DEO72_LG5g1219 [Vigna unguiculata]
MEEEEGESRKLVVCNRCKTDYIVQVNGLLRSRHRSRIGVTPFRWCVEMVKPLDINGVLLKHTLSRTSRTVTNMPFRLLDNLDNLNQYNWSRSVHRFLVEGFNRGYHTLRQDQNTSAIIVAGSVAVLQLLVCRLLSLRSYEGDVIFPRILSWSSLMIRTHGIKSAFEYNKDQLSSMEEEYARGGEELDASFFHQPLAFSFHKGDAFDVEEPQSCNFDQLEQCTSEYNHHGMEIIPIIELEKCSLDVDLTQLYRILVSENDRKVVVDINQQILTTIECWGFHPRGKLCNMAILFACNTFMYRQRKLNGLIKRVVFGPLYKTAVVEDSRKVKAKRRQWILGDAWAGFSTRYIDSRFCKNEDL